jgi:hypothetical protein
MSHENQKAVWIEKSISYRLGIASKLANKTIQGYVMDAIKEAVDRDLSGLNLDTKQNASYEYEAEEDR